LGLPFLFSVQPFPEELCFRGVKILLGIVLWCILFALCWPLALLALVLFPIIWLVLLPFRLVWVGVEAVLALVRAILFLPARLLGYRSKG